MNRLREVDTQKIKLLRSQGYSLPEISKKLKISKSTVFRHAIGTKILPEFINVWKIKRGGSKAKKILAEQKYLEQGKKIVQNLSHKEKLLFLSALYWAEGSKKDFGLSNTDPNLIHVFVRGLKDILGIKNNDLRVSVRIYEDLEKNKCISFWSKIVGLPKNKFLGVNILPGKKNGKLKYGMCRVRVAKGGNILKKIQGINKAIINEF